MKIRYKNTDVPSYDVWFLERIKDFEDRKLLLGWILKNKKRTPIVSLVETRTTDGKVFINTETGQKAERIIRNEKPRVLYTRQEVLFSKRGKPYGLCYGENKEIHNNKGEVIAIRQKRCDYYGQKEVIKEIPLKLQ